MAAPDMYSALKQAEQLLRDVALAESGDHEQDACEREAYQSVLAAIAKAEGSSEPSAVLPPTPIGHIEQVISDTPPPGWLFCNGQHLLREDYPELYELFADRETSTPVTFRVPYLNAPNASVPECCHLLRYVIKAKA
jgi:hypothetical protein